MAKTKTSGAGERQSNAAIQYDQDQFVELSKEICKRVFNQLPEDVISPTKSAADALFWLDAIFHSIKDLAEGSRNSFRIQQLAEAGAYIAFDIGNYAGVRHEEMTCSLQAAGLSGPQSSGVIDAEAERRG